MKPQAVHLAERPEVVDFVNEITGMDNEGGSPRVKQIMHRLVSDLFKLMDDLDVRPEECWQAVNYLNQLGGGNEAGLLAAGLGIEHYVDMRLDAEDAQADLLGGTPRTIEGPLYIPGAPKSDGVARMDDGTDEGEVLWLHGQVTDADSGAPLAGAVVDVWHADTQGNYSFFDASQSDYNLRRRIVTDANGRYAARSIVPSGYGCPPQSATQQLLDQLGRHGQRPAHIHFFVSAPGHEHLTTQINLADDAYLHDDFAYATRDELIAEVVRRNDPERAKMLDLPEAFAEIEFDFSLKATTDPKRQAPLERPHAVDLA